MNRRELIELKIAMEFGVAPDGDTLPAAHTNDEGHPQLLVSRFDDHYAVFFRFDVPADLRDELTRLDPDELMHDEDRVTGILARHTPCEKVYRIRWYMIERMPEPSEYPDVSVVDGRHVIMRDGAVFAWAQTDRENSCAAEASIETVEEYRRRGYARQVTTSWAASVLKSGKVAYYSHLADNAASRAVATRLGMTHLSDEVEYV